MCLGFANPTFVAAALVFTSTFYFHMEDGVTAVPVLSGAVALIVYFISAVIQVIRPTSFAGLLLFSRSLDHTFLLSMHLFCSIMESIWLLSISLGKPTSFSIL